MLVRLVVPAAVSNIAATITLIAIVTQASAGQSLWMDVSALGPADCRAITVASDGDIYVGQGFFTEYSRGVLRTTDRGITWSTAGLQPLTIEDVAVHPNGNLFAVATAPTILFRSTDKGTTWTTLTPPTTSTVWGIAINSKGWIYAASESGMSRSTDLGISWTELDSGLVYKFLRRVYVTEDDLLFARSNSGLLYRSLDDGLSWTDVSPFSLPVGCFAEWRPQTLLASTLESGSTLPLLYRSTDNGTSWVMQDSALVGAKVINMIAEDYGSVLAVTNSGSWRYSDSHWERVISPPYGANDLARDSAGNVYSVGDGGVSISANFGENWGLAYNMQHSYVTAIATTPSGEAFAATSKGAVSRSTDQGARWITMPYTPGIQSTHSLVFDKSGTLYAGSYPGGVYRSTNSGYSWENLFSVGSSAYVSKVTLGNAGLILTTTSVGTYRSTDYGATWSLATGVTSSALLISSNDICLIGDDTYTALRRSSDRGATWSRIVIGPYWDIPTSLTQTPSGKILAGLQNGDLYWSRDEGVSWTRLDSSGLPQLAIMVLYAATGSIVFASLSNVGTYRSTDEGDHWESWGSGLPGSTAVTGFAVDPLGYVYAGSGAGMARTIQPVTSVSSDAITPVFPLLRQNYPNPFNPSTTIEYALPRRSYVTLTVYNTLGQSVSILTHGEEQAGYHEVRFNASGLASGVYFCRLQVGDFAAVRKLLLLR